MTGPSYYHCSSSPVILLSFLNDNVVLGKPTRHKRVHRGAGTVSPEGGLPLDLMPLGLPSSEGSLFGGDGLEGDRVGFTVVERD